MIQRAQQVACLTLAGVARATKVVSVVVVLVASGCEPRPLPEEGSVSAELYRQRCGGTCHILYYPTVMTAGMWTAMVERMEIEMYRRGVPLGAADKDEILAYLHRNSGTQ